MDHFLAAMRGQGVHVAAQVPEGARTAHFNLAQQYNALSTIRGAGIGVQHVRWGKRFGGRCEVQWCLKMMHAGVGLVHAL